MVTKPKTTAVTKVEFVGPGEIVDPWHKDYDPKKHQTISFDEVAKSVGDLSKISDDKLSAMQVAGMKDYHQHSVIGRKKLYVLACRAIFLTTRTGKVDVEGGVNDIANLLKAEKQSNQFKRWLLKKGPVKTIYNPDTEEDEIVIDKAKRSELQKAINKDPQAVALDLVTDNIHSKPEPGFRAINALETVHEAIQRVLSAYAKRDERNETATERHAKDRDNFEHIEAIIKASKLLPAMPRRATVAH